MTLDAVDLRVILLGVFVAALMVGACGVRSVSPENGQTSVHSVGSSVVGISGEVPRIGHPPPCDDTGACAAGFMIDDNFYTISCGAVRPEVVSQEVLAKGGLYGDDVEVRRIESVDPEVLVAVSNEGGRCAEGEPVLSPWSMAFPGDLSGNEVDEAVCHAVVAEHQARNGCS